MGLRCDQIAPADLGTSLSFTASDVNTTANCEGNAIDGSGNIAVAFGLALSHDRFWHLYRANAVDEGRITAFDLFPQGCGFEGVFDYGDYSSELIGSWAPDRGRRTGALVGGDLIAGSFPAFPNGIFTLRTNCGYPTPHADATYEVGRFDPTGATIARANFPGLCAAAAKAIGSEMTGKALLVVAGDPTGSRFAADDLVGVWLNEAGNVLTGWFRIGRTGLANDYALAPLIGGGVAVRVDGVWAWFVPGGEPASQPSPDFLAANSGADVALIRGGHAYAILPRAAGDTSKIKLYSASGEPCGSLSLPGTKLVIGGDGTVMSSSGSNGCTKRVWPKLLR